MKFNTVKELWQEFRTKVLRPETPEDRALEMRVAFYCGLLSGIAETTKIVAENNLGTQIAETRLNKLQDECIEFSTDPGQPL